MVGVILAGAFYDPACIIACTRPKPCVKRQMAHVRPRLEHLQAAVEWLLEQEDLAACQAHWELQTAAKSGACASASGCLKAQVPDGALKSRIVKQYAYRACPTEPPGRRAPPLAHAADPSQNATSAERKAQVLSLVLFIRAARAEHPMACCCHLL